MKSEKAYFILLSSWVKLLFQLLDGQWLYTMSHKKYTSVVYILQQYISMKYIKITVSSLWMNSK